MSPLCGREWSSRALRGGPSQLLLPPATHRWTLALVAPGLVRGGRELLARQVGPMASLQLDDGRL